MFACSWPTSHTPAIAAAHVSLIPVFWSMWLPWSIQIQWVNNWPWHCYLVLFLLITFWIFLLHLGYLLSQHIFFIIYFYFSNTNSPSESEFGYRWDIPIGYITSHSPLKKTWHYLEQESGMYIIEMLCFSFFHSLDVFLSFIVWIECFLNYIILWSGMTHRLYWWTWFNFMNVEGGEFVMHFLFVCWTCFYTGIPQLIL